jgi:hypothetical protein
VNWVKGGHQGPKKIFTQVGNNTSNPWAVQMVGTIPANLSARCDVTSAKHLEANRKPKVCLEGQQPGHVGFVLSAEEQQRLRDKDPRLSEIVKPFLNGDDLISGDYLRNPTWVIDFGESDVTSAQAHSAVFEHLRDKVLPDWQRDADEERKKTGKDAGEHQNRIERWWQLKRRRGELLEGISRLSRYIVCSAVTKRPIFEFISSAIRPSNALKAFLFEDDYSFGILQSGMHWAWFTAKGSALTERYRYTPDTVFDTFPWPQFTDSASRIPNSALAKIRAVAEAAVSLRALRREIMAANGWSLRDLYRTLETPGTNRLRDAQAALDSAVRSAYGMADTEDPLAFLLKLNLDLAAKESIGESITPPGLLALFPSGGDFISPDCIHTSATASRRTGGSPDEPGRRA